MKANELINKFGLDRAIKILAGRKSWTDKKSGRVLTHNSFVLDTETYEYEIGTLYVGAFTDYNENSYRSGEVNLLLLERLVKSHNIVTEIGTLDDAKDEYFSRIQNNECAGGLNAAIADVELCQ